MVDFLGGIFASIFGSHSILATIIIAMLPVIELKGAIPVGMSAKFWGENALSWGQSFWLSLLGSCLVVPILALIFNPLITWLKQTRLLKKLGEFIEKKVKKHSKNIEEKSQNVENNNRKKTWIKMIAIFAFVAVPLPLTGVWTGACVAVAVGLNFWQTCLSCVLGNMVAGIIIATVCAVFPQFTTILFLIMLAIVVCVAISSLIKMIISKRNENNVNEANDTDKE